MKLKTRNINSLGSISTCVSLKIRLSLLHQFMNGGHMKITLSVLFLIFFFESCTHNLNLKPFEINSDAFWENFLENNKDEKFSLLTSIQKKSNKLYDQIHSDSLDPILPTLWGQSINFDSGAKAIILDYKLINELQAKFKIKNDNHIVHAGIMHTYGYLFSTLMTPYGFKRIRWTKPTLNNGLELNHLSLSPFTVEGTLLSNITYFSAKIAFKNPTNLKKCESLLNVSPEIKNYDYKSLSKVVLDEYIVTPSHIQKKLRTTLVKFKNKLTSDENDYLLIYSFEDLLNHEEKLITAFPIKTDAYLKIIDSMALGEDRPIIVRYNAFIGTSQNDRLSGKRLIFNEK